MAARFSATGSSVLGVLSPLTLRSGIGLGAAAVRPDRRAAQGESRFLPFGTNLVIEHRGKTVLTPLALLTPGASGAVLATTGLPLVP